MTSSRDIIRIGSLLAVIGVVLLFSGVFLSAIQNSSSGEFGGLVLIGPVPIVFGSSPQVTTTMMYVGLFVFLIYLFLWRRM